MGWSGGTEVAIGVWNSVREYIPEEKREEVANEIIDTLTDQDWDCVEEAEQLCKDAKYPETCWECGEEFVTGTLNNDGLCRECEKANE